MATLVTVLGPTASGKTRLAIELSQEYGASIFSADSRQVYQEMTIGTAKPTREELAAAPHRFINTQSISRHYTAGDYERDVIAELDSYFTSNDIALLAGGSGLYIRAVTQGLDEFPKVSTQTREDLADEMALKGFGRLVRELEEKDPEYFELVDEKNPARVLRALEVIRTSGKSFSSYFSLHPKERPFNQLTIGIEVDREELYERIDARVDDMIDAGLEQEVLDLYNNYGSGLSALHTVGYQEFFPYFEKEYPLEEAIRLIKRNTRRYAKRQMTWFRKIEDVHWFKSDDLSGMQQLIEQHND